MELSTSTIYDTIALRSERELLRNVFDGKNAEVRIIEMSEAVCVRLPVVVVACTGRLL